jgi:hypothetical protein
VVLWSPRAHRPVIVPASLSVFAFDDGIRQEIRDRVAGG